MHLFWILLATFNLIFVAVVIGILWTARHRILTLSRLDSDELPQWPFVSVIVAARNEQRDIEVALRSLLKLDYDPFEIIVVDDRSEDETPKILARIQAENEQLRVLRINELPAGWLGKNHALWMGADIASGDYLLFTDADVVLHPSTLRRAISYAERHGVDHLTLAPRAEVPTMLLQAFVVFFTNMFVLYTRPWKVSDPNSPAFVGIGAFNLVRCAAYKESGTHQVIAMRPDDDVKLGKIIKQRGLHQEMLNGADLVTVPWYASSSELIHGMEKNAFSGVDYSIVIVVGMTVVLLLFDAWPFLAVWVLSGAPRFLYAAVVGCLLGNAWLSSREARVTAWTAFLLPVVVLLLIYIQWRAMLLTYLQGGIRWRGTLYPLEELRRNRV